MVKPPPKSAPWIQAESAIGARAAWFCEPLSKARSWVLPGAAVGAVLDPAQAALDKDTATRQLKPGKDFRHAVLVGQRFADGALISEASHEGFEGS